MKSVLDRDFQEPKFFKGTAGVVPKDGPSANPTEDQEMLKPKSIDINQQAGVWTRDVLERIGPETFLYGGNLCQWDGQRLDSLNPAELVSYVDSPERCWFGKYKDGEFIPRNFTEAKARILLGAIKSHSDLLRHVEVVSLVPVLVWQDNKPVLICGYDPKTKTLASGRLIELPHTKEAVFSLPQLLRDFKFKEKSDYGRTIAFMLSLA